MEEKFTHWVKGRSITKGLERISYGHEQGRFFKHECYSVHQAPARKFQIISHER